MATGFTTEPHTLNPTLKTGFRVWAFSGFGVLGFKGLGV